VEELISELKLEGTEDTLIGGKFRKGISGGQRKRVEIALELISDPPVMFLDEPTSGLDSYTSEIIIKKLSMLARQYGKTIIYVIHQPNSHIFNQMDKLMLLYKGRIIYFGDAG
jgi:ABC-type multidrug transport system ATPase subunit